MTLTPREVDILRYAAQGYGIPETAQVMYLSPNTIKGHRQAIFTKLKAANMTQAVARAIGAGVITSGVLRMTPVETEMAWTSWGESCRHRDVDAPDLRQCRRRLGHPADDGGHASGFGDGLRRWQG